jgi:hypothetical protein
MVDQAWQWEWSSAQAHISGCDPSGLLNMDFWRKQSNSSEWKDYLERIKGEESIFKKIRNATMRGFFLEMMKPRDASRKSWGYKYSQKNEAANPVCGRSC